MNAPAQHASPHTPERLEKTHLRLGFVALSDAAPLVAAKLLEFGHAHGLTLELCRQPSWAAVRDKLLSGDLDAAHARLGMGPAPQGAMFEYLARAVSAAAAIHGGLCFVLSADVRRYGPVITYIACAELAFACVLVWVGVRAGLPQTWVAVEAAGVVLASGVTLGLRAAARRGKPACPRT